MGSCFGKGGKIFGGNCVWVLNFPFLILPSFGNFFSTSFLLCPCVERANIWGLSKRIFCGARD